MVHIPKHYQLWHMVVAFVVGIAFVMGVSFVATGSMKGEFRPITRSGSDSATLSRIESKIDLIMQSMNIFTAQWTGFTGQWTAFTSQMTNFTFSAQRSFLDLGKKNGLDFSPYFKFNPKLDQFLKNLRTTQFKMSNKFKGMK
jgi:hypothetical protein